MLFVGPEAADRYGRRHFLELVSAFAAAPEVTVWHGRDEIGTVDPAVLAGRVEGPRILALAGRSWQVNHVDWIRRRAWVEPSDRRGSVRWTGTPQPLSSALCDAMRRVLLGEEPEPVRLTRRAGPALADLRDRWAQVVDADRTVLHRDPDGRVRWWTWAGGRANALVAAALARVAPDLVEDGGGFDNRYLPLADVATGRGLAAALDAARREYADDLSAVQPKVDEEAVHQLKFADLLPPVLANQTLATRMIDQHAAAGLLQRGIATVDG